MTSTQPFALDGRTALVTGAGGHLGRAIVDALHDAGAHVLLVGRKRAPLDEVAAAHPRTAVLSLDVNDAEAVARMAAHVEAAHGELSVLVNNAYSGRTGTMSTITPGDFLDAYGVSVASAFGLLQALRPALEASVRRHGDASVVNVASMYATVSPDPRIYGESGMNNPPSYGPAKAGLLQLTRYAAVHLAPVGIRVNAVSPGACPPESVGTRSPEFAAALVDRIPLGRLGRPADIGQAVRFLASPAASYITGVNLPIDGGWTAW